LAKRDIRYQGAIVRDEKILLIYYVPVDGEGFWMLPGGGREDESEEECVVREMHEETQLEVRVERLLIDLPAHDPEDIYQRRKTYLCSPSAGEPAPGFEPGADHLGRIAEVAWFDLRDERSWGSQVLGDEITYPQLTLVRQRLGYD
jgi:8-oxo-dGTP pyrophosphatase MutT (NUDIX family)